MKYVRPTFTQHPVQLGEVMLERVRQHMREDRDPEGKVERVVRVGECEIGRGDRPTGL